MDRPVLTANEARVLIDATNCRLPLDSHKARNDFQIALGKLVQIAGWQENDDVGNDGAGEGGQDTGD